MYSSQSGQTLIELIIVVSVLVIVTGALVFATIASLRNAQFSKNQLQATKLAQEGIERVRIGRDRNQCITFPSTGVNSWNGNSTNSGCTGSGSIWTYQITGALSNCDNPTLDPQGKCYFNIDLNGLLVNIGYSQTNFPDSLAEGIPSSTPVFRRAVTLSDETATFDSRKTVNVIVQWNDFAGSHQSSLTTILSKQ